MCSSHLFQCGFLQVMPHMCIAIRASLPLATEMSSAAPSLLFPTDPLRAPPVPSRLLTANPRVTPSQCTRWSSRTCVFTDSWTACWDEVQVIRAPWNAIMLPAWAKVGLLGASGVAPHPKPSLWARWTDAPPTSRLSTHMWFLSLRHAQLVFFLSRKRCKRHSSSLLRTVEGGGRSCGFPFLRSWLEGLVVSPLPSFYWKCVLVIHYIKWIYSVCAGLFFFLRRMRLDVMRVRTSHAILSRMTLFLSPLV